MSPPAGRQTAGKSEIVGPWITCGLILEWERSVASRRTDHDLSWAYRLGAPTDAALTAPVAELEL